MDGSVKDYKKDSKKEGDNMTKICPDDGTICTMKEDDKNNRGCWLCPKIQELREGSDCGEGETKERISRTGRTGC